ncbi:MAG: carbohydrate porin [Candidatus Thiodiazotropha sp.]|nr:carbohydrate porin [Candidatus Thiodiazotropha sp.]MCM8883251.1 carbohydrate porin [Candidatus Thiodiazotropha sp.]MCM8920948.1 carbohydrate porin [Candidatus Thiodiazotropha sp.]
MSISVIRRFSPLVCAIVMTSFSATLLAETDPDRIFQEIQQMKQRIQELEHQLTETRKVGDKTLQKNEETQADHQETEKAASTAMVTAANDEPEASPDGIKLGGAVRLQYSNERYREGNRERGGDFDFDIFRINLDGKVGGVLLSAEWRWFQYMNAVHHAWIGYDFGEGRQGQIGIQKVPFGVLPYNSHNFFFSSNYYVGLEDDYDAGIKYLHKEGPWDLRFGFYFNDEQGGADGFVDNREDRYSYDVVGYRAAGEGTFDQPGNMLAENNTWNARVAYQLSAMDGMQIELGISAQYGLLHSGSEKAGNHDAYAIHLVGDYGPWNLQLQAASYEYDVNDGADLMAVGAYSFYDTIPAEADSYTANLSYSLPVSWGPVTNLTFYNDYSLITNKSAGLDDTWMNVLGMALSAGGLYTYFDFISAENQPFIGGSMGSDSNKTEHRFNINLGYYF